VVVSFLERHYMDALRNEWLPKAQLTLAQAILDKRLEMYCEMGSPLRPGDDNKERVIQEVKSRFSGNACKVLCKDFEFFLENKVGKELEQLQLEMKISFMRNEEEAIHAKNWRVIEKAANEVLSWWDGIVVEDTFEFSHPCVTKQNEMLFESERGTRLIVALK
jgi:hypothetical protein